MCTKRLTIEEENPKIATAITIFFILLHFLSFHWLFLFNFINCPFLCFIWK